LRAAGDGSEVVAHRTQGKPAQTVVGAQGNDDELWRVFGERVVDTRPATAGCFA